MKNQNWEVAVFGALNVDVCGAAVGGYLPKDSNPGTVSVGLGGVGWNMARSAAALGARTAFFSVLGTDAFTPRIDEDAAGFGVDISACVRLDAPNSRYVYITDHRGDMTAAVNDMRLCERFDENAALSMLPRAEGVRAAVLDANLPERTLRVLAQGLCVPVAADCVSAAKCRRLLPVLPRLRLLKANRLEAEALTGQPAPEDAAAALLALGVKSAVVSDGTRGLVCAGDGGVFRVPAQAVKAVSTNGAGDALTAALAVGLARGLSLPDAARLGARAAALTASEPGGATLRLRELAPVCALGANVV